MVDVDPGLDPVREDLDTPAQLVEGITQLTLTVIVVEVGTEDQLVIEAEVAQAQAVVAFIVMTIGEDEGGIREEESGVIPRQWKEDVEDGAGFVPAFHFRADLSRPGGCGGDMRDPEEDTRAEPDEAPDAVHSPSVDHSRTIENGSWYVNRDGQHLLTKSGVSQ